MDKYPADKYNLSFQEIAQGIQKYSSSPEIEILKLLQLKAFSYLIGNGDLHAKNIKRQNFITFGKRYGLSEVLVESMLNKLLPKFNKNYEKIFSLEIAKAKEKYLRGFFSKLLNSRSRLA